MSEVKNFLKIDVLTFNTIDSKIKKTNPLDFAWQLESLTGLMEVLQERKDQSIEIIIEEILNT